MARLSPARRAELAREIACERIHEGLGVDVEDLLETDVEGGVGVWVRTRVLVEDEDIEALAKVRAVQARRSRRRGRP